MLKNKELERKGQGVRLNFIFGLLALIILVCGCKKGSNSSKDSKLSFPENYVELSYSSDSTTFSFWSPLAEEVRVMLFDQGDRGAVSEVFEMKKNGKLWSCSVLRDLKDHYFTFNAKVNGKWLGETPGLLPISTDLSGKRAAIIDWKETYNKEEQKESTLSSNNLLDAIIYEIDLEAIATSSHEVYLSLLDQISHLSELGITHVLFSNVRTQNEELINKRGIKNLTVPWSGFSSTVSSPANLIRRFRTLIESFHQAGIGVVLEKNWIDIEKKTAFTYSYPYSILEKERGGEEVMQDYLIESLLYWQKEYGIDGFHFIGVESFSPKFIDKIKNSLEEKQLLYFGTQTFSGEEKIQEFPLLRQMYVGNEEEEQSDQFNFYNFIVNTPAVKEETLLNLFLPDYLNNTGKSLRAINSIPTSKGGTFSALFVDQNPYKLKQYQKMALAYLLTSTDTPLLRAGEEFFMSEDKGGLEWFTVESNKELFFYVKELIRMRKSHPAFKLLADQSKRQNVVPLTSSPNVFAYSLVNHANGDSWKEIVVAYNRGNYSEKIEVATGKYTVVANEWSVSSAGLGTLYGPSLYIAPHSVLICYLEE